jgi:cytochrome c6
MRIIVPLMLVASFAALACGDGQASSPSAMADGGPGSKGEELFNTNCTLCHGRNGDLGMGGAKDLTVSVLTREQMIAMVTTGKGAMMPYKNVLTPKQIEAVVDHARKLRKAG